MNNWQESSGEHITIEAARWFEGIREGEFSSAESKRFACWLAASPVHVREYLSVSEAWGALKAAQQWPELSREEVVATIRAMHPAGNVSPLAEGSHADAARPSRFTRPSLRFAIAAALALLAISATWLWHSVKPQEFRTARGEQRSLVLLDGSIVQLNTLTEMAVHIDAHRRRVMLPQGEAFFRVARDPKRPFVVETPFARVLAVGTEFNVYHRPEGTHVAVIEGRVQVAPSQEPVSKPIALGVRQSVDIGVHGKVDTLTRTPSRTGDEGAPAWIQRRIVLDNTSLDAAVIEFNRYNALQMRIEDSELADLRITGVFRADNPHALMKYLRQVQGVEIQAKGTTVILRKNPRWK